MMPAPFDDGMTLSDFHIGIEFTCADRIWRCTDIGTRVVVAIRVDSVEVSSAGGSKARRSKEEAEAEGWFNGPPYGVLESVFDEEDMKACIPVRPDKSFGEEVIASTKEALSIASGEAEPAAVFIPETGVRQAT